MSPEPTREQISESPDSLTGRTRAEVEQELVLPLQAGV